MIGDEEAVRGCQHLTSVFCISLEAKVILIKKDEFLKIKQQSEEGWQVLIDGSKD